MAFSSYESSFRKDSERKALNDEAYGSSDVSDIPTVVFHRKVPCSWVGARVPDCGCKRLFLCVGG